MIDLKGYAIVVTRPEPQARGMAALVTAANGVPIVQSGITIVPAPVDEPSLQTLSRLSEYSAAVFTSPNAIMAALERVRRPDWPADLHLCAVGDGTRNALLQRGFPRVVAPEEGEGAMALAPQLDALVGNQARVLMIAAPGGRKELEEHLHGRGVIVDWCYAYRRKPAPLDPAAARRMKGQWGRLIVTATSRAILDAIVAMDEKLKTRPLIVPSQRLREEARALGFAIVAVSRKAKAESMLEAATRFID